MTDRPRASRLPVALLVLMTIATLGGPIGFGAVLRGGARRDWPPDRAIEWATLAGISGLVLALMILAIALAVANQRAAARIRAAARARQDSPTVESPSPPNAP